MLPGNNSGIVTFGAGIFFNTCQVGHNANKTMQTDKRNILATKLLFDNSWWFAKKNSEKDNSQSPD